MNKIIILLTVFLISCTYNHQKNVKELLISSKNIDEKIEVLLNNMTLAEKLAQIRSAGNPNVVYKNSMGAVGFTNNHYLKEEPYSATQSYNKAQKFIIEHSRYSIPAIFYDEAISGLKNYMATTFPQPLAQAATWNPELIYKMATAIAKEARNKNIHQVLSPVINIVRDPRWGRTHETFGEDPYLTGKIGAVYCLGMHDNYVISTPKHFIANQGTAGHNSGPVDFSERILREIYFPPFKMCINEGKAKCIMAAYNSVNGIPCSSNKWLLTDVLRNEWNFNGYVISDYGAIAQMVSSHGTVKNKEEATEQVINAGIDVEAPNYDYFGIQLETLLKEGRIKESQIDDIVRRILRIKFDYKIFENPYGNPDSALFYADCQSHRQLSREISRQSIVLLKNRNNILPLRNIKNIAICGPYADTILLGGYAGWGTQTISLLEGLKRCYNNTNIVHSKGAYFTDLHAVDANYFSQPDNKGKGLYAEYFNNMNLEGKPINTRIDSKIDFDWDENAPIKGMNNDFFSIRWTGYITTPETGYFNFGAISDAGVRIFLDDKLIVDNWGYWASGLGSKKIFFEKGRKYKLKVEYMESEWFANIKLIWDCALSGLIPDAVAKARNADIAIVVVGAIDGEGRDRARLELPLTQEMLIKAIVETGTPTLVVLQSGNVVAMGNWANEVDAILEAWYPGEEGGNAIADVISGKYNPGGKIPITFPYNTIQVPLYYNERRGGAADYNDISGNPLFPFGFGLSYTSFEYSNLKLDSCFSTGDTVKFSIDLRNIGACSGDEVVQVYIKDEVSSICQPEKKLVSFKRVSLKSGEKKHLTFKILPEQLSIWDKNMKQIIEAGEFTLQVGSSSIDIRLKNKFRLKDK